MNACFSKATGELTKVPPFRFHAMKATTEMLFESVDEFAASHGCFWSGDVDCSLAP